MRVSAFAGAAHNVQPQQRNYEPLIAFFGARPDLDNLVLWQSSKQPSFVIIKTVPGHGLPEGVKELDYNFPKTELGGFAAALEQTGDNRFNTLATRLRAGDAVYNAQPEGMHATR
jgi:hypothetical protein